MDEWHRANMLFVSAAISIALGFATRLTSADLLPNLSQPRAISQGVPAPTGRPKPPVEKAIYKARELRAELAARQQYLMRERN
jgi:hypothetical protein